MTTQTPQTYSHPTLLKVQKPVSPSKQGEYVSAQGPSETCPLLRIHNHVLPPASGIIELENGRLLANFPSEGFRLLLTLLDKEDKSMVIGGLLRPKKDSDLSSFVKPLGLECIMWAGCKPDL